MAGLGSEAACGATGRIPGCGGPCFCSLFVVVVVVVVDLTLSLLQSLPNQLRSSFAGGAGWAGGKACGGALGGWLPCVGWKGKRWGCAMPAGGEDILGGKLYACWAGGGAACIGTPGGMDGGANIMGIWPGAVTGAPGRGGRPGWEAAGWTLDILL